MLMNVYSSVDSGADADFKYDDDCIIMLDGMMVCYKQTDQVLGWCYKQTYQVSSWEELGPYHTPPSPREAEQLAIYVGMLVQATEEAKTWTDGEYEKKSRR